MVDFSTQEEAADALSRIFIEKATAAFMTPVLCGRFEVSEGPDGEMIFAVGGGGVITMAKDGQSKIFTPKAGIAGAFAMPLDTAQAFAEALTQHVARRLKKDG